MGAPKFDKDWVAQYRSKPSAEEQAVKEAFEQPVPRRAPVPKPAPARKITRRSELPEILTIKEAAAALRYKDPETVKRLIKAKKLGGWQEGVAWRVPVDAIAEYQERKLKRRG